MIAFGWMKFKTTIEHGNINKMPCSVVNPVYPPRALIHLLPDKLPLLKATSFKFTYMKYDALLKPGLMYLKP